MTRAYILRRMNRVGTSTLSMLVSVRKLANLRTEELVVMDWKSRFEEKPITGRNYMGVYTVYCLTSGQVTRLRRFRGGRTFLGRQERFYAVQVRSAGTPLAKLEQLGFSAFYCPKLGVYVVEYSDPFLDSCGEVIQRAFGSDRLPAAWVDAKTRRNFGI